MSYAARLGLLVAVVTLAAVSAACDNSNPAGPSASGAIINGSLVADRALPGATVSVAGTSRGATVDGNRRFTLRDVPGGTVQLQFKGPSLDGSIQLSGVQPSDTIELTVNVNGSTVTLASERRGRQGDDDDDDDDDEAEVEGTLTSITGISPALTLIVGGRTVITNAATVVRMSGVTRTLSVLALGQRLEVEGQRQGTTILAEKIQIEDDDDDDEDEIEFTGTLTARTGVVPNLTLVVAGRTVLTNVATEIRTRHGGDRLDFSAIVLGVTLEVKADRRPDGTLVARRLRVGN